MSVVAVSTLDWPTESPSALETATVHCAGECFFDYELRRLEHRNFRHGSSFFSDDEDDDKEEEVVTNDDIDLLALDHDELEKMSYYTVLGEIPMHSTPEQVKRAYHKACLKYHPDKTGRGEEDEVFLKVKAAFDTLSDVSKRKSYDSSVDFDDSIPKGNESPEKFYKVYGPVFERNLRFDARYDPEKLLLDAAAKQAGGGKKNNKRNNKNNNKKDKPPPKFGDDDTPIKNVHEFYDHWIHFESWRDYTLKATKLTDNQDIDNVESRYEKRYIAKEIDRKAKSLKREEMARINTLVERAMAADPRIKREKAREKQEKQRAAKEKKDREEAAQKAAADEKERAEKEKSEREERERTERQTMKAQRDKEKKQLRKARQLLRKLTLSAYTKGADNGGEKIWSDMEAMNDDVELLCTELSVLQIVELTDALGGTEALDNPKVDALEQIKQKVEDAQDEKAQDTIEAKKRREEARKIAAEKAEKAKAARAMTPWSKEEVAALAKAIKKYPAGGANRWETIALFVNNICRPETPRAKEECIEQYNKLAAQKPGKPTKGGSGGGSTPAAPAKKPAVSASSADKPAAGGPAAPVSAWTDEQDKMLQAALKEFPTSMDKNERWTSIAKKIPGKGKKDCVQRFKTIREALKKK